MKGSRTCTVEPGHRVANSLSDLNAGFRFDSGAFDAVAESWMELEHQTTSGPDQDGTVRVFRASDDALLGAFTFTSTPTWAAARFDMGGIAGLTPGVEYYVLLVASSIFLRVRGLVVRYEVGRNDATPVQVGQGAGLGRTLATWEKDPALVYPLSLARPRIDEAPPLMDRSWVQLNGTGGSTNSASWVDVNQPALWEFRPSEWGGIVSFALEVTAAGPTGVVPPASMSEWEFALFYADTGQQVIGSVLVVDSASARLREVSGFAIEGGRAVKAMARRTGSEVLGVTYVAVRLVVTQSGDVEPIGRLGWSDDLAPRQKSVTGTTWDIVGQSQPPVAAGMFLQEQRLEATMRDSGTGGVAELRLSESLGPTPVVTITTASATDVIVRSADVSAALLAAGVETIGPSGSVDWPMEIEARGSTATDVAEIKQPRLAGFFRVDPVSDEFSITSFWIVSSTGTADLAAAWAVDSAQGLDLTAAWAILSGLTLSKTSAWAVASAQNTDAAAAWLVRDAATPVDLAAAWVVSNPSVFLDVASAWKTSAGLNLDRTAAWAVANPRILGSKATWLVSSPTELDIASAWSVLRKIDVDAAWRVDAAQTLDMAAAWVVAVALPVDLAAAWMVDGDAKLDRVAAWLILDSATKDRTAAWLVKNAAQVDTAAAWGVRSGNSITGQAAWAVANPRTLDPLAAWRVKAAIDLDLAAAWIVDPDAFLNVTAEWRVLAAQQVDQSSAWLVSQSFEASVTAAWAVISGQVLDPNAAWLVLDVPTLNPVAAWSVLDVLSTDLASSWTVVPGGQVELNSPITETVTMASPISATVNLTSTITIELTP